MINSHVILPIVAALGHVALSSGAHANVFELRNDGHLVEISQPVWQAELAPIFTAPSKTQTTPISTPMASQNGVRQHIQVAAARYGVDSKLVDAVAWQESRYNPRARSSAGAIGVMQLMPGTARQLGVRNPHDVQ